MGVYYFYINETKKEYFCIDPTGSDIKSYALGRNIGSRILSYLIFEKESYCDVKVAHPLIGSWIGDRFYVAGDDFSPNYDRVRSEFDDIGQTVIDMIIQESPYDLIQYGGGDWLVSLMRNNGDFVTITEEQRRKLLKEFRYENYLYPVDELEKVIDALRPKSASE